MACMHSDEANNLLDDGTRFLKYCPNWKDAPLFREWQKYAKMCFRGGWHFLLNSIDYGALIPLLGDVHTTQKGRPKTVKPPISIHIKSNGCPDVPAITNADGYNAKAVQAVLRDYITTHIRELSVNYFSCVCYSCIRVCLWEEKGNHSMGKAVSGPIFLDKARMCSRWLSVGRPIQAPHWRCV